LLYFISEAGAQSILQRQRLKAVTLIDAGSIGYPMEKAEY
jgi:hypothetical protein